MEEGKDVVEAAASSDSQPDGVKQDQQPDQHDDEATQQEATGIVATDSDANGVTAADVADVEPTTEPEVVKMRKEPARNEAGSDSPQMLTHQENNIVIDKDIVEPSLDCGWTTASTPRNSQISTLEEPGEDEVPYTPTDAVAAPSDTSNWKDFITFHDGKLSCVGLDLNTVPDFLASEYAERTTSLDLSYNELRKLENLEGFSGLTELILDNNRFDDTIEFPELPNLTTLTLNKNSLSDVEALLTKLRPAAPAVTYLSLLGNEACPNELVQKDEEDYQRYRYLVLYLCPNLKFLDSRPVTAAELAEAKRSGEFMKVVRVSEQQVSQQQIATGTYKEKAPLFRPLPKEERTAENHRGTIGTLKYVYYGKHSEGNRFIRNSDL